VALQPLLGPGLFCSFVIFFWQTVGILGRVISPSQGHYLHTGQHKHRINAHPDILALSGIPTHVSSVERAKIVHAVDRAATVTGRRAHNLYFSMSYVAIWLWIRGEVPWWCEYYVCVCVCAYKYTRVYTGIHTHTSTTAVRYPSLIVFEKKTIAI
jgi:hypothetical protein